MRSVSKEIKRALNEGECRHWNMRQEYNNPEPINLTHKGYPIEVSQWTCDDCLHTEWGYKIWTDDPVEDKIYDSGFKSSADAIYAAREAVNDFIKRHNIRK